MFANEIFKIACEHCEKHTVAIFCYNELHTSSVFTNGPKFKSINVAGNNVSMQILKLPNKILYFYLATQETPIGTT